MRPWKIGDVVIRKFIGYTNCLVTDTAIVSRIQHIDGAGITTINLGPSNTWISQNDLEAAGWHLLTKNGETKQD